METSTVLITGSNGEMGHELIKQLSKNPSIKIIATDLDDLDPVLLPLCEKFYKGNILDSELIEQLTGHKYQTIYHLASILSTKAERQPELAQKVNVNGTLSLLELADQQSQQTNIPVKFFYPSSIAVYGLSGLEKKQVNLKVNESEFLFPITMYGCNKLYCEHLGRYYSQHYRQMTEDHEAIRLDFRSIRFPGLISAMTLPTGGTSDYGPEMIHHAAQNKPYNCFVRPDSRLPFMVMPDAIRAISLLIAAPCEKLTQKVYNVTSFNPSAEEIYNIVRQAFPGAEICYNPHPVRQKIVDSWPSDVDDAAASKDWGWSPEYNQNLAFNEYLIPTIKKYYS